jgi:hypothetical protein
MFNRTVLSTEFLNSPVSRYAGQSAYAASSEVGLELELEGFGAEMMGVHAGVPGTFWAAHRDPSLMGDAVELVLARPLSRKDVTAKALPQFVKLKNEQAFKPALSSRCSLHVHMDFSHKTMYSLIKFITLYALYEPYFFESVGRERKGNHFCLRLTDAYKYVRDVSQGFAKGSLGEVGGEGVRYMALNLAALFKFGSVEVRLHEGTADENVVQRWVDVLFELVDLAKDNFTMTPSDYIYQVSGKGLREFTQEYLPKTWELIKVNYHDVSDRIGIEVAQDFAFCADWSQAPKEAVVIGKKPEYDGRDDWLVMPKQAAEQAYINALKLAKQKIRFHVNPIPEPFDDMEEEEGPF